MTHKKKLVPRSVSELWKEFNDNPCPEWAEYFQNNTVKLLDSSGNNETIAEKVDKKYRKGA